MEKGQRVTLTTKVCSMAPQCGPPGSASETQNLRHHLGVRNRDLQFSGNRGNGFVRGRLRSTPLTGPQGAVVFRGGRETPRR